MLLKKTLAFAFTSLIAISCFAQKALRNWTGFYIGPDAGISFNKLSLGQSPYNVSLIQISGVFVPGRGIVIVPGTTSPFDMSSTTKTTVTGGIQLGYMRQFNQWVAGLEGDINFLSVKAIHDKVDMLPPTALEWSHQYGLHHTATVNLTESIRAKFGWAQNNSLIYLTAGAAFANVKATAMDFDSTNTYWPQPPSDGALHPTPAQDRFIASTNKQSANIFAIGFTLGAGYEWILSKNCDLTIEYRYSMPQGNFNVNPTHADTTSIDARPTYAGYLVPGTQKIKLVSNQLTVRLDITIGRKPDQGSDKKRK
jgi:opacity protein-like surface antigen